VPPCYDWKPVVGANQNTVPRRRIRSFVRREGRLTPAQRRALEELLPRYGVPGHGPLDPVALFGRRAPLTVEVGFGNGEVLAHLAAAHPERDHLGIEVHRPGVGRLLNRIHELGLANVRVAVDDAMEVLPRLPEGSIDLLLVFFPDPWHKKRHHKRRLVNAEFARLAASRLRPGGRLHLATDWEDYARQMLEVLGAEPALHNLSPAGDFVPRPDSRPVTRFEARGRRLGHEVFDLLYERRGPVTGSGGS